MNQATEIRKLNPSNIRELVHILEDADSWKRLMEIIPKRLDKENYECNYNDGNPPKYNSEHFRLIERASRNYSRPCSEILLDEWGTSGRVRPAMGHLLHLLIKAEIFRAADFIAIDLLNMEKPKRPKDGPAASVTFLLDSDKTIVNSSNSNTIVNNMEKNLPVPKKQVNLQNGINGEVSDMIEFSRSNELNEESIPEDIPGSLVNSGIIPNFSDLLQANSNRQNRESSGGNSHKQNENDVNGADVPQFSELLSGNNGNIPEISELMNENGNNNCLPLLSRLLLVSSVLHSIKQSTNEESSPLPLFSKLLSKSENSKHLLNYNNSELLGKLDRINSNTENNESFSQSENNGSISQSENSLLQSENNKSSENNLPLLSILISSLKSGDKNDLPLISNLLLTSTSDVQVSEKYDSQQNASTNEILSQISAFLKSLCNDQSSFEGANGEETSTDLIISKKVKEILLSKRLGQYTLVPEASEESLNDEICKLLQRVNSGIKNATYCEEETNNNPEETESSLEMNVLSKLLGKIEEIVKEETQKSSLPMLSELLKSEICKNEEVSSGNVMLSKQFSNCNSGFSPRINESCENSFLPKFSSIISNGAESEINGDEIIQQKGVNTVKSQVSSDNSYELTPDLSGLLKSKEIDSLEGSGLMKSKILSGEESSLTPALSELLKSKNVTGDESFLKPALSELLKPSTPTLSQQSKEFTPELFNSSSRENDSVNNSDRNKHDVTNESIQRIESYVENISESDDYRQISPRIDVTLSAESSNTDAPLTKSSSALLTPNPQTDTSNEITTLNSNSSNRPQCNSPLPNLSLKTILPHYNYYELESATDCFDETPHPKGRFLGSGAFGSVFLCLGLTKRPTAVKKLHLDGATEVNVNDTITKQFRNEVELLCSYKHDNLLSICGYSCDGPTYCIIYEYISGGALNQRLEKNKEDLHWRDRLRIACGTADAVAYLHTAFSRQLIHRDIKTANILLDPANKPKLGDFGIIKLSANKNTTVTTTIIGTSVYMAPESFRSGEVTDKTDTFSFGVVILELLTALPPFDENREARDLITHVGDICDNNTIEPLLDLSTGPWMKGETNVAEELFTIANKCLAEKKHRPNMVEVADLLNKLSTC